MADVLQRSATARHAAARDLWLDMLQAELDRPVEAADQIALRPWLLRLIKTCTENRGDLARLAQSLEYLEQNSTEVTALWQLVDEWDALDFYEGADLRVLRTVLQGVGHGGLAALARRASGSRTQELPAWCTTAWYAFLHLAGGNSPAGALPVSMAFLALVADRLVEDGQQPAAEALRRWNREQARAWGLEGELAGWQRDTATPVAPSLIPAYLLIQLAPDGIDPDRFHLSHWRQSDADGWHPVPGETRPLHRTELATAVEELIEAVEEGWADLRAPVVLEFILPWELLNEPVEWWSKESDSPVPTPLVMDYPVVLRSLERLRRPAWHRRWRLQWRQLTEQAVGSHPHWSRPTGREGDFYQLERELKEDQQAVCLVLSEPPSAVGGTGRQEILAGLRAGLPAMIWHRHDCEDPAFRDAVSEMLEDRGLGNLVERVSKWRKEALALGPAEWDGHVGRHLAILLDDPDRLPGPAGPDRVA
ncbi:hypothetical protein ACFYNO_03400 [Kitasatospora sp. NPDC006697]|uniref:VMAP-C domain-containing protein n=1 Tax=Kitasatospora sp. NPDC006697 TaxID=3364020 RepID=UPI00368009EC